MTNPSPSLWQDPAWIQQVHTWIRSAADRHNFKITGEIDQAHVRVWSTVMRIPTSEGMLFFKATANDTLHEVALTRLLADWFPDLMPELLDADLERGWMLMRDAGQTLRASLRPTQNIRLWTPILRAYAGLQIELAEHVQKLLALRLPDHRPSVLPQLYKKLLADEAILMVGQEKGLTPAEYEQLQALAPRFEQICNDLIAYGIPDSLNHGDFHDANVLLREDRITFFDWGDANVTHPFVSLRTLFVSIEMALNLEEYAFTPEMSALLEEYLEPWQKFASLDALRRAYALSKPVASISKAVSWWQTVAPLEGATRQEFAWIVPEVLREFLVFEKMLND